MISSPSPEISEEIPIRDLATLRLLADARRHAIVQALTPRALTARELAVRLGTSPTKLYYHLKMLEAGGIVRVAGERVVSGIIERSYRAVARGFVVERALLSSGGDELADAQAVILDETAAEYRRRGRRGGAEKASVDPLIARSYVRCAPAQLLELRRRLAEIVESADDADSDDGDSACLAVALFTFESPGR